MPGKMAPIDCPDCGGKMWDNSETKKGKQPDYACKDKQGCGKGVWLKDSEKAAISAVAPAQTKRPPVVLDKMMKACVKAAISVGDDLFKDGEVVGLDHALTLNMATTLFIARCRGEGILEVEKKVLADLAAKQELERKAAEEAKRETARKAAEVMHGALPDDGPPDWMTQDDDNSLPF